MPMYAFECPVCKKEAEELRKMTEMNEPKQCDCGNYMQRIPAKASFKIPGGHNDEYGKHGRKKGM